MILLSKFQNEVTKVSTEDTKAADSEKHIDSSPGFDKSKDDDEAEKKKVS